MKKLLLFCLMFFSAINAFSREIKVSVIPGVSWNKKHTPQFAIWIEDTEGNYISTLYVTKKAFKRNWIFAPKEGRPESLPVWYNCSINDSNKSQESNAILSVDAVSGATPKKEINFSKNITDKSCVIKAEFNISFDYNDSYTKANSSVNGQPSIIYEAKIEEGTNGKIELKYSGTGSVNGSDGKIHKNTLGLTTATSIAHIDCILHSSI